MIKADTENTVICSTCQQPAIVREVFVADSELARKIFYETHAKSIIDPAHIAALGRAEAFYKKLFQLNRAFKDLPDEEKIIRVENPDAAGVLLELDFGSETPSACKVRTIAIPLFILRTFGKEREITLNSREVTELKLDTLMEEVRLIAKPIIEEAKSRHDTGLW